MAIANEIHRTTCSQCRACSTPVHSLVIRLEPARLYSATGNAVTLFGIAIIFQIDISLLYVASAIATIPLLLHFFIRSTCAHCGEILKK
jgi:hypothetical protein